MGALRATLSQRGNVLRLRETLIINQRNIATSDYAALKEVADAFRELSARQLFLAQEGKGG